MEIIETISINVLCNQLKELNVKFAKIKEKKGMSVKITNSFNGTQYINAYFNPNGTVYYRMVRYIDGKDIVSSPIDYELFMNYVKLL